MKRRAILIGLVLLILCLASLVLFRQCEYQRESYQGKHTRDWAWALLSSLDDTNRLAANAALRALGSNAVPPLRRMLRERDKFYEKPVADAARVLSAEQRRALLRQLKPGQAMGHRLAAIASLGAIGPAAAGAIPDLTQALADPNAQIRWDAARALLGIGDAAIPTLISAATGTNVSVRHAAIYMLGEARTNAPLVVPTLFNALLDSDATVRATAIYSVGRLGQNAVPPLIEKLNAADPAVQVAAMRALGEVRLPLRLSATNLLAIATNSSGELRRQTIETLGLLRVNSAAAATVLVAALDDSDPAIRLAAIKAVGEISWRTADAIPRLMEFTQSTNALEREAAARALAQFGPGAGNAVPALTRMLADPEAKVRDAATNALARINTSSRPP